MNLETCSHCIAGGFLVVAGSGCISESMDVAKKMILSVNNLNFRRTVCK